MLLAVLAKMFKTLAERQHNTSFLQLAWGGKRGAGLPNHGGRERPRVEFKEGEKERKTKRRKLKQNTRC